MVKIQERNGQFFITIPREYVQKMKWKKGDVLIINAEEDRLEIFKVQEYRSLYIGGDKNE